ncbi:hypothetical protein ACTWQB_16190 [Piscibacillus sp. B03]|uniref:hypothetical protein n=1 Tax=Piscibacillus sp. B03 TaxID=3457430 RepID=UPI003FCE4178
MNHHYDMLKRLLSTNEPLTFSQCVSKWIIEKRIALGVTQQDLVQHSVKINRSFSIMTLSKVERGHGSVQLRTLDKIFMTLDSLEKEQV